MADQLRPNRNTGLDFLRGIAVLLVLGRHLWAPPPGTDPLVGTLASTWICGGWIGVDLFFVLSGFLVSGLLFDAYQKHGKLHVGRFLVRRGFKIYPAFYALLLFTLCLPFINGRPLDPRRLLSEALFVQNYFGGIWDHTWSLAVEEHFYIGLPILLIALTWLSANRQNPFRAIPWVFGIVACGCLVMRVWNALYLPQASYWNIVLTHLRIDSLLCGTLLAYLSRFHADWFQSSTVGREKWFVLAGIALFVPSFLWPLRTTPYLYTAGYSVLWLGSALLLVGMMSLSAGASWFVRGLAWIGVHSYSIYLWHLPVKMLCLPLFYRVTGFKLDYLWASLFYMATSIAVGFCLAKLIEIPLIRLRDAWFPSQESPSRRAPIAPDAIPTYPESAVRS